MDGKQNLIQAVDRHMEGLDKSELIMVLNFIYSLEDFR